MSQSPRKGQATLVESAAIELESLSQAVGPTRTVNPGPADITDLAYDARRVTAGALFACVPASAWTVTTLRWTLSTEERPH